MPTRATRAACAPDDRALRRGGRRPGIGHLWGRWRRRRWRHEDGRQQHERRRVLPRRLDGRRPFPGGSRRTPRRPLVPFVGRRGQGVEPAHLADALGSFFALSGAGPGHARQHRRSKEVRDLRRRVGSRSGRWRRSRDRPRGGRSAPDGRLDREDPRSRARQARGRREVHPRRGEREDQAERRRGRGADADRDLAAALPAPGRGEEGREGVEEDRPPGGRRVSSGCWTIRRRTFRRKRPKKSSAR